MSLDTAALIAIQAVSQAAAEICQKVSSAAEANIATADIIETASPLILNTFLDV